MIPEFSFSDQQQQQNPESSGVAFRFYGKKILPEIQLTDCVRRSLRFLKNGAAQCVKAAAVLF